MAQRMTPKVGLPDKAFLNNALLLNLDLAVQNILADRFNTLADGVVDQLVVAAVPDVIGVAPFEAEDPLFATLKLPLHRILDRGKDCLVNCLGHAGQHTPRRKVGLIHVGADHELVRFAGSFDDAHAARAGGLVDDIRPLAVLAERKLLAFGRIVEGAAGHADEVGDNLDAGVDELRPLGVATLEFSDNVGIHAANEADGAGFRFERRDGSGEERSLLLLEDDTGEVCRNLRARLRIVVDAGKLLVGELTGDSGDVVGEEQTDADDQLHVRIGGHLPQSGLAVGSLA